MRSCLLGCLKKINLMIRLDKTSDCCGCGACVQRCPKQCISMIEDIEGFLYPSIDIYKCVDCGMCDSVCPVIHQGAESEPLMVYAAKNRDEDVRSQSSSGGVFSSLAQRVISRGGVVFGAVFDARWEVKHAFAESVEELAALRASKYMQSRVEDTFNEALRFLKEGREVLFCGTPCQISGLNLFLGEKYDNLITVDIICHGVPSPKVWRSYLNNLYSSYYKQEFEGDLSKIEDISFRDKGIGWRQSCLRIKGLPESLEFNSERGYFCEPMGKNIYTRGFLANIFLRPSCYVCPSKSMKSGSDITLADYWGIQKFVPEMDDNRGTNLLLIHNEKSLEMVNSLGVDLAVSCYADGISRNRSAVCSPALTDRREAFFGAFEDDLSGAITANIDN